MDYILLLTIVSGVLSVIGFFVSIFKDRRWKSSVLCVVTAVVFICMSIYVKKLEIQINRIEGIQRAAEELIEQRNIKFSSEGFIQAALAFLETNKDLYPDTYGRAVEIEQRMHESKSIYAGFDASREIQGIAILNDSK